jgi:DNA-binding transcriptional regulator YiaG
MDTLDIRALRQELGLTRGELAGRLRASPYTVKHWENDQRLPGPRMRRKLDDMLQRHRERLSAAR